jgi:hypothetical protein
MGEGVSPRRRTLFVCERLQSDVLSIPTSVGATRQVAPTDLDLSGATQGGAPLPVGWFCPIQGRGEEVRHGQESHAPMPNRNRR